MTKPQQKPLLPGVVTGVQIAEEKISVDWICRPLLARGAITEITGEAKRAGKSTFIMQLVKSILDGHSFLSNPTKQSKVLYLTEESAYVFKKNCFDAGLTQYETFFAVRWRDVCDMKWPLLVQKVAHFVKAEGIETVIFDTLPQFTLGAGVNENDAGDAMSIAKPLQKLRDKGYSIVIVRHERKGGGKVGESSRGSTVIGGAIDIILQMTQVAGSRTQRKLSILNRLLGYSELTVDFDTTTNQYFIAALTTAPKVEVSQDDLVAALQYRPLNLEELKTNLGAGRRAVQQALRLGVATGDVVQVGRGKKGEPATWEAKRG
jgi:biotin operon repressor